MSRVENAELNPSLAEARSGAASALRREGWRALAEGGQIAASQVDAQARDCIGLHTLALGFRKAL